VIEIFSCDIAGPATNSGRIKDPPTGACGSQFRGDGCLVEFAAPQAVAIEPGHDGWAGGDEPAVMIEFDFERDTVRRLGMPAEHSYSAN
jgi:hypothetical protein